MGKSNKSCVVRLLTALSEMSMAEGLSGHPRLLGNTLVEYNGLSHSTCKKYMADYLIRRTLFFQVCVRYHIYALSSPSKLLPPFGNSFTICY